MANFRDRMKQLRKERGLSQEELAKRLKVSRSCVGNYEQGTREPSYKDLMDMCTIFNVDIDYMLGNTDIPRGAIAQSLSPVEEVLIDVYRKDKATRDMIDRLLAYALMIEKEAPHENN